MKLSPDATHAMQLPAPTAAVGKSDACKPGKPPGSWILL